MQLAIEVPPTQLELTADRDSLQHGDPLTLHWKVVNGAGARITAERSSPSTEYEGTTGDGGRITLQVAMQSALPASLVMYDGSGEQARWEFDLHPGDASNDSLDNPIELSLDEQGNGEGDLTVNPEFSSTITLSAGEATARVNVAVANFIADLLMPDGSPAPSNMKCTLTLGLLAGDAGDGTAAAAA
jgi:hypothetical protein